MANGMTPSAPNTHNHFIRGRPLSDQSEPAEAVQVTLPEEQKGSEDDAPETTPAPSRVHYPSTLPLWPTSQPGPRITRHPQARDWSPGTLTR